MILAINKTNEKLKNGKIVEEHFFILNSLSIHLFCFIQNNIRHQSGAIFLLSIKMMNSLIDLPFTQFQNSLNIM